jgi:hypothetical protein
MITILRIPQKEQYSYIEVHFEGTPEEALAEYARLTALVKETEPNMEEFCAIITNYADSGVFEGGAELWEKLSFSQKGAIQAIKRLIKRN